MQRKQKTNTHERVESVCVITIIPITIVPRPRSFWSAPRVATSGWVQHRKSAIHGLPVKSDKPDWLRIRNEYSAYAKKIEFGQRS